jgi:UDP-N-acetyl-D-mannosaminuronic acid transferase (WecB/TagA/CpsF family)
MRQIGLEWLFRLFPQPPRAKRIFNAVVVFPIKIIFDKKKSSKTIKH